MPRGEPMTSASTRTRLGRLLAERTALRTGLDDRCAALLAHLRRWCPGAVPPPPAEPGGVSEAVAVDAKELDRLLQAALAEADDEVVLLVDGESELLVDPARSRARIGDGLILVVLGVECDQTGPVEVTVPFAVGSDAATAGMVMATEQVPRGPAIITVRWGEALVAMAWEALVAVTAGLSRHVGTDLDAAPLIPGALVAAPGSLTMVSQARHEADRLSRP
jgi:hypothetical protein